MTSRHFSGEKATKKDARKALMAHAAGIFDGRYTVKFDNDDGGSVINLYIEVEKPSGPLPKFLSEALFESKWMGWRYVITKCPPGYIDAILEAPERDDY
jgi:hypothetical protein